MEATKTEVERIVIVGGVAGGASAAARARRLSEDAEIVLVERGPHVSFANCGLPYHVGGEIADREKLFLETPESLGRKLNLDVRVRTEAVSIDREGKTVTLRSLDSGELHEEPYDKLILSPGASPIRPPLPGIDDDRIHTLRTVGDADRIKAVVDGGADSAIVIGGGFIGLEVTENLVRRGISVTLVEMLDQVMPPFDREMVAPLHQALRLSGVDLRLGQAVKEFDPREDAVVARLSDDTEVSGDFVMLAIGVRPETSLASEAALDLGELGGISVNERQQTSDPDIYAVGDVVDVTDFVQGSPARIPLAGPANRQGRIAADHIFGRDPAYRGTQGTSIVRIFGIDAAMTGASEKALVRAGRADFDKVYIHPNQHAGYYPGAVPLRLKVIFSKPEGRVLGAQVTGADGVDKRIDVLAMAIQAGMTVHDLEQVELAYAPQFGSAKDPVNFAGFVAANVLADDLRQIHTEEFDEVASDRIVLDVREKDETDSGGIDGAILIPLGELRSRMDELPRDRKIVILCATGVRSYLAYRTLTQHGFDVVNVAGGYRTWSAFHESIDDVPAPACPISSEDGESEEVATDAEMLDVSGLCCPGPLLKVREKVDAMEPGSTVAVKATDMGFATDVGAWCKKTGNSLLGIEQDAGAILATIRKEGEMTEKVSTAPAATTDRKTLVVFSQELDKVLASFVIANGALAMGSEVTMFHTFWGLNALRHEDPPRTKKGFLDRMFGWMMPRGPGKLKLSKMHMAGIGTSLMKKVMRDKNVATLPELMTSARDAGVRLVACSMSMDVMGITKEELIDGVEIAGVADYLGEADQANVNLFV